MKKIVCIVILILAITGLLNGISYLISGISARGIGGVNYGRVIFPLLVGAIAVYFLKRRRKIENFQFVGAVMFFPPHTHLKIDAHHKAIRPLRRPEGWPPYTLPGGQLPTDGTSGTPPLPLHKTKCGRLLTKSSLPHLLV
ncbi:hypothetical protein NIA69_06045 [Gemmiger formicilis]|nr:hypothetical protein [Gemmiger formicilis]